MVRSYWNGALVLTLAWVGAAGAQQQPLSSPPGQPSERILTLQEPGKPAERVRVLSSQPLPDGKALLKVQSLTTGEFSTIIDGYGGGAAPKTATPAPAPRQLAPAPRQYGSASPYGGSSATPLTTQPAPASVRQASVQAPAKPSAQPQPMPVGNRVVPTPAAQSTSGPAPADGEYLTIQENGKPPMRCRMVRRWQTPEGHHACQLQCVETGEMLTVVAEGPVTPVSTAAGQQRALNTRIYHWGRYTTPPAGAPVPPGEAIAQAPAPPAPCTTCEAPVVERPRRLFGRLRPAAVEGAPCACDCEPSAVVAGPGFDARAGSAVVVEQNPRLGERLRNRVQGLFASRSPAAQPVETMQIVEPVGPPKQVVQSAPQPAKVAQASPYNGIPAQTVVAPPPSDWRKSWTDDPTARTAARPMPSTPVAQAPPPMPAPPPPAPVIIQTPARLVTTLPRPPMSVTEVKDSRDPLLRPDNAASRKVDGLFQKSAQAKAPPPAELPRASQTTAASSPLAGKVPLGAQSVLAASNGLDRPIQYVPVPIVTVPEAKRPPLPPVPEIPQAPHPNEPYQNAFTPMIPPDGQAPQQAGTPGYLPQGGSPMMGQRAMGSYPPMMGGYPGMMPGYNPMMARYPMPGYNPTMAQPPMPVYGYGPMAPGMVPPAPYGMPMGGMYGYPYPPMGMPQVPGRGVVPFAYQGPMPPNPLTPTGQPYPYGYRPMPAPVWPAQPRNTAMDRPAVPAGMGAVQSAGNDAIREMLATLKTSSYPSQREWAANNLATFDWRAYPVVVDALLSAAKEDPAASVRSGCVYNLARMQVKTEPVLALLRQLQSDRDPRVRTEAEHALVRLSPTRRAEPNAIQPVRAVNP